jgi:small subunit ribosomal protein S8
MSFQDSISDFVARINNALLSNHKITRVRKTKSITSLTKKLVSLKLVDGFSEDGGDLVIQLNPLKLKKLRRLSKPGQRVYVSKEDIIPIINGFGYNIISTSKGIMTDKEVRANKIGGEAMIQAIKPYLTKQSS